MPGFADAVGILQIRDLQHINAGLAGVVQVPGFGKFINWVLLNKGGGVAAGSGKNLLNDLIEPEVSALWCAALQDFHIMRFFVLVGQLYGREG